MTDAPTSSPVPGDQHALPDGSAASLRQQLASIDETPRPSMLSFGRERQFWRDTAIAQAKSRYLGEYLVYLVGRVEALEAEVAALRR